MTSSVYIPRDAAIMLLRDLIGVGLKFAYGKVNDRTKRCQCRMCAREWDGERENHPSSGCPLVAVIQGLETSQ